jgi:hypothetical protein
MKSTMASRRKIQRSVLVAAIGVALLMFTVGLPSSALGWGIRTITVWPSGGDDTPAIQSALDTCASYNGPCIVQLMAGTYHVSQIEVTGFNAVFRGVGENATQVVAMPHLRDPFPEYNTPASPFWSAPPSTMNPWPVLFTFVDSHFTMGDMSIADTHASPLRAPGWTEPAAAGGGSTTALFAMVLVTGTAASATLASMKMAGTTGDLGGYNVERSMAYAGMELSPGAANPYTGAAPLSGTFTAARDVFYEVGSSVWVQNLQSATVSVLYTETLRATDALGFEDVSHSTLSYVGNLIRAVSAGVGIEGMQSLLRTGLALSTVVISGNQILGVTRGGSGVALLNFGNVPELRVVVAKNLVDTSASCGCVTSGEPAILGWGPVDMSVSENTITGGGSGIVLNASTGSLVGNHVLGSIIGIDLIGSNGVLVSANVVEYSLLWGLEVSAGSAHNMISGNIVYFSGQYDLVEHEAGSGNVWIGNECRTSEPPGLCISEMGG